MALNDTNIASSSSDVVAVLNATYQQVFKLARPMKAQVREPSRSMTHPVETGSIITDNRIILPAEIDMKMILPQGDYRSVYQQIRQLWLAGTLLIVQTKASSYPNMLIENMPHEEDVTMFDTIEVNLKFMQAQLVQTQSQALPATAVKNAVNQSTIQIGTQQSGINFPVPAPVVDGTNGSSLPQIPPPATRSTLNVPALPPPSPMNDAQYESTWGAAAYTNVKGLRGP